MTAQETIARMIEEGLDSLLHAAAAMPEDKYDWKPAETSRTAHELFTEAVTMFATLAETLENRKMGDGYQAAYEKNFALSVSELAKQARKDVETLTKTMREFPDSELEIKTDLPWGTFTYFGLMSYPYWNMMWHAGQINYIQTMYGDMEFR